MKKAIPPVRLSRSEELAELAPLDFTLPPSLEATEPPEARGLARDEVRLLVSHVATDQVVHTRFRQIGDFLEAGDVLVINTSGTLNAALPVQHSDGTHLELHLSTHLPANLWVVEMRSFQDTAEKITRPFAAVEAGETFQLPAGGLATLHTPYAPDTLPGTGRLWIASLYLPTQLHPYLAQYGSPIRYSYVKDKWPSDYYQTVYATEPGSAEMPSAGRAFTSELITRLVAHGVQIVPLLLHCGVSSLEEHEPPYEEYYRVPAQTAEAVNSAHHARRRVIAIGTTVVRALETVTDRAGVTHPGEGWTDLLVTPQRGVCAVDGLLTGMHEPQASHLAMLEAICGRAHLQLVYSAALAAGYLWHEFGDLHLLLP